jgi:hypothetical protein
MSRVISQAAVLTASSLREALFRILRIAENHGQSKNMSDACAVEERRPSRDCRPRLSLQAARSNGIWEVGLFPYIGIVVVY